MESTANKIGNNPRKEAHMNNQVTVHEEDYPKIRIKHNNNEALISCCLSSNNARNQELLKVLEIVLIALQDTRYREARSILSAARDAIDVFNRNMPTF